MTKEEIAAEIKRFAERHGHVPSFSQFKGELHVHLRQVKKHFGSWTRALKSCGMSPRRTGRATPMEDLFKDWAAVVRKTGKIPSRSRYRLHSKYSTRPLMSRLGAWTKTPAAMYAHAVREGIDDQYKDVIDIIARHHEDQMTAERKPKPAKSGPWKARLRNDRPVYGAPLLPGPLTCEPVSEGGVIFLFGMLARNLGFAVTRIHTEFPDCEALCRVEDGKWQKVRIEFEYASKNFIRHMHDPDGCDLIVCWVHDWPECRLDVIELRSEMKRLQAGESVNR